MKLLAIALLSPVAALASTTYTLPDPAITVNPNYGNNTTIVTFAGVSYRGPSNYYYLSECSKPDGTGYHCDVLQEDNVVLTSPLSTTVTVSITMQSASILIRSGHNYWRNSQTVLGGTVTLP